MKQVPVLLCYWLLYCFLSQVCKPHFQRSQRWIAEGSDAWPHGGQVCICMLKTRQTLSSVQPFVPKSAFTPQ